MIHWIQTDLSWGYPNSFQTKHRAKVDSTQIQPFMVQQSKIMNHAGNNGLRSWDCSK